MLAPIFKVYFAFAKASQKRPCADNRTGIVASPDVAGRNNCYASGISSVLHVVRSQYSKSGTSGQDKVYLYSLLGSFFEHHPLASVLGADRKKVINFAQHKRIAAGARYPAEFLRDFLR